MTDDTKKPPTEHLKLLKEIQKEAKNDVISAGFNLIENNVLSCAGLNLHHENIINQSVFTLLIKINGNEFQINHSFNYSEEDDSAVICKALSKTIAKALEPGILPEAHRLLSKLN